MVEENGAKQDSDRQNATQQGDSTAQNTPQNKTSEKDNLMKGSLGGLRTDGSEDLDKTGEAEDPELIALREKVADMRSTESINAEKAKLQNQLNKSEFRQNHSKLLKVTNALEKGSKGLFRGMGSMFKKTMKAGAAIAEAGNKMDAKLADQQRKESGGKKATKKSSSNEVDDALNFLD